MSETYKQSNPASSSNAVGDDRQSKGARRDGCKGKRSRYAATVGGGIAFIAVVVVLLLVTMMINIIMVIISLCRVLRLNTGQKYDWLGYGKTK